MTKEALLIFTKNPVPGKVKTRLAATVRNDVAFSVYQQLVKHTLVITSGLPVDKFVFYSDEVEQEDVWNEKHYLKQLQQGNNLGERMNNAFASTFKKGVNKVVVIGTDCPGLDAGIIMNAFTYLDKYNVVIGPAADGGYYLLGMKQHHPQLFENIPWSTNIVLEETISKCVASHLDYWLLPVLNDIDEEKDLIHLKKNVSL